MTVNEILELVRNKGIEAVDFRFLDFPGLWQHFTIPASGLDESSFTDGLGFDGSSMRGWKGIEESDMLVVPDPSTAWIDPFPKMKTLVLVCDIKDPITHESYSRDPRNIARKAEAYLQNSGLGDQAFFGPEAEFFIFDDVRFDTREGHKSFYQVDASSGWWNTGAEEFPNLQHKIRPKGGYVPCPPADNLHDLRTEMAMVAAAPASGGARLDHVLEVALALTPLRPPPIAGTRLCLSPRHSPLPGSQALA